MDKRVLLLCSAETFMVNAMRKNLEDERYSVETLTADVNQLSKMNRRPQIVLVYMDKDADKMKDVLVYLKDLVEDDSEVNLIYFVGNPDDLDYAKKIFPDQLAAGTFLRPLNVKILVEKLNNVVESNEFEKEKKHILVVDDDGTMLRTLKLWLSDKYTVYMANSGVNAISLLAKNKVDLILLDYEMPVANGPQVLEMLRNEPSTKDTPVMFLTARNDKESVLSVMDLKPEKYLLKTMPPDVLMKNIDDFFAEQRGRIN
ncbi:MAG: response regulator [Lachnospiraceae bacterium]|nr:response regulator [Lachnospiraceae bacterium]